MNKATEYKPVKQWVSHTVIFPLTKYLSELLYSIVCLSCSIKVTSLAVDILYVENNSFLCLEFELSNRVVVNSFECSWLFFWFKRMQSIGTLKIGRPNLWRLQCTQRIIEIVAAALERMFATVFCNSFQSINCKLKRVFLGGPGRLTPVSRAKSFAALIYGSFKISNQSRCCCPFHLVQTMCRPMVAKTL